MLTVLRIGLLAELLALVSAGHDCTTTIRYGYYVANCQNLGLKEIPWNLPHNVHKLHFENNSVRRLVSTPFSKYEEATELYLKNNSMVEIGSSAFRGLRKLEMLDLENNRLAVIPTATMKHIANLKILNLKNNALTYIDNHAFAGLTSLKEMYLTNNHIINLAPDSFANLPHVQWFSLHDNLLRTVDRRVMKRFDSLLVIRLYNNPWQCDCSLRWLKAWLMDIEQTRSVNWRFRDNEPICHSPPHVAGMKFSKVSVDKFACPAHITSMGKSIVLEKAGENVNMDCRVVGDPTPHIYWYKNGYILNDKSKSKYRITKNVSDVVESRLEITNFDKKDVGSYRCMSKNTGGTYNISYNIRLKGYKPKYIAPVQTNTDTESASITPLTATTIIAAVAGSIVFIMAIALVFGIICCHRRTRAPQFSVKLDHNVQINGAGPKDYSMYEDVKCNDKSIFHEIHGDSPYESMKTKAHPDYNEPRYCTYISFRSDPSDPDDLTNCYVGSQVTGGSRDHSHTESTSPLLEGYRMNVPSPRFIEQMYEHNSDYCNTLPYAQAPIEPPRSAKRSSSAGSLSGADLPPKKPPRLYQMDSPMSENVSFGSVVTTPSRERQPGTPL